MWRNNDEGLMRYDPIYFELKELVCKDVYNTYKDIAWQFFDQKLLLTIDRIREKIGKPIFVNSWDSGGDFDERGFRCLKCGLVKSAIAEQRMYVSPHMTGQGVDFDVQGLLAEEVRQWIVKNANLWPYPLRLEAGVNWIHLDLRDTNNGKVFIFNP
jgi:hypothetical protein